MQEGPPHSPASIGTLAGNVGGNSLQTHLARCLIAITRKAKHEVQLCAAQVFKRPSPFNNTCLANSLARSCAVQLPAKMNLHRFTVLTGQPPFVLEVLWILALQALQPRGNSCSALSCRGSESLDQLTVEAPPWLSTRPSLASIARDSLHPFREGHGHGNQGETQD